MIELACQLGELELRVALVRREVEKEGEPYLDWLECRVRVSVPSFSGSGDWEVMPHELSCLADDLIRLYEGFPERGLVTFNPTYPNLTLEFQIETNGAVGGRCSVLDDFVEGDSLQCKFSLDQSCLPRLANEVRAFVRAATAGSTPASD